MGVGPKPIPIDKLDTPSLVDALLFMMQPEVQAAAKTTGKGIEQVGHRQLCALTRVTAFCAPSQEPQDSSQSTG